MRAASAMRVFHIVSRRCNDRSIFIVDDCMQFMQDTRPQPPVTAGNYRAFNCHGVAARSPFLASATFSDRRVLVVKAPPVLPGGAAVQEENAMAGNRSRVASLTGMHDTSTPPAQVPALVGRRRVFVPVRAWDVQSVWQVRCRPGARKKKRETSHRPATPWRVDGSVQMRARANRG